LADAERLSAWVYQIARNVIRDYYRSQSGSTVALADGELEEDQKRETACTGQTVPGMNELIRQLPEKYQEAVQLSEIEGLTQQEVADRLGISLSGAKSRIQRGRALLKNVLDQCCAFEFDRRGNLLDVIPNPHRNVCRDCGDSDEPTSACS